VAMATAPNPDARFGSISEVGQRKRHVRFPPVSDKTADIAGGPFRANRRHLHVEAAKKLRHLQANQHHEQTAPAQDAWVGCLSASEKVRPEFL
jgi:hypothetical protein